MLTLESGCLADSTQFESSGFALYKVTAGRHKGHAITLRTDKYECGAWSEQIECSCGAKYHNALSGCHSHKRSEKGDQALKELSREAYNLDFEAEKKQSFLGLKEDSFY